jgi:hypothetical protein
VDTCRFFEADDALRWAVSAYYGACHATKGPLPYNLTEGRKLFLDAFMASFLEQVMTDPISAREGRAWVDWMDAEDRGGLNARRDAELPSPDPVLNGDQLNGLPSSDNASDNQAKPRVENA